MLTSSCSEVAHRFSCEKCHYYTSKKSSYDKHIMTAKHLELTKVNTNSNKSCSEVANNHTEFSCKLCNKPFKSRVGIWKHNKKCIYTQEIQCKENLNAIDKYLN